MCFKSSGKIILFFILIFSSCNRDEIANLSESKVKIESYISLVKDKSKPNSERINYALEAIEFAKNEYNNDQYKYLLSNISVDLYYLEKYELFKKVNLEVIKMSKNKNDSILIAKSYSNLGSYFNQKNLPDSAYYNFNKSSKVYNSLFDQNKLNSIEIQSFGATKYNMALIQKKFKAYIGGEKNLIEAINIFEKINDSESLFFCYNNLGIISKNLGKNSDAIKYYERALNYTKFLNNGEYREIQMLNNIGVAYKNKKQYDRSIANYKRALTFEKVLEKKPSTKATLIDNLAYVNFLDNKKGKFIIDDFLKALKIRDSINNRSGLITSNLHLAEYYKSESKNELSKYHANESLKLAKELASYDEILSSLLILKDVDNNSRRVEHANLYIKINDSIQSQENLSRDKFARIRFETDQKEQQIIKVQNQNTVYLLGMLLLLSLIGFALFFFRQRTKYLAQQNKIVQTRAAYETETRISKRLHDELGNDIFQVMLQYQTNPHDPEIVNRLNKTYNKARDISRENSEFEVDETYGEELTDMLQNYTNNGVQLILRGMDKLEWDNFSSTIKIAIYRVLQELMTNMQKHSQASLVAMIFAYDHKILTIKYSDNGVGIPAEQLTSKNGLRNTEKRIKAVNGTFTYESKKDQGFKVFMEIPV